MDKKTKKNIEKKLKESGVRFGYFNNDDSEQRTGEGIKALYLQNEVIIKYLEESYKMLESLNKRNQPPM